jgi:hypothetical protein
MEAGEVTIHLEASQSQGLSLINLLRNSRNSLSSSAVIATPIIIFYNASTSLSRGKGNILRHRIFCERVGVSLEDSMTKIISDIDQLKTDLVKLKNQIEGIIEQVNFILTTEYEKRVGRLPLPPLKYKRQCND